MNHCVISNRTVHPTQILDIGILISAKMGSDHSIVLCQLCFRPQIKKTTGYKQQEKNYIPNRSQMKQ